MARKLVMDGEAIRRALVRISHEILERHRGAHNLVLIGVRSRGVPLAERIRRNLAEIEGVQPKMGTLDIGLYRDDLRQRPFAFVQGTDLQVTIDQQIVILVDDVLYTGRTVRAAMDELSDFGRPAVIQLAVLVDRGHRELPIRADFIGKNIPTAADDAVRVSVTEIDGQDAVYVENP